MLKAAVSSPLAAGWLRQFLKTRVNPRQGHNLPGLTLGRVRRHALCVTRPVVSVAAHGVKHHASQHHLWHPTSDCGWMDRSRGYCQKQQSSAG